ncbi:hypothetical protein E3N88_43188 [Mikania micrantha]|uniref:Peroxisomal membrane protein 11C n=1 Tax=Mikania micrantha TaxID=192012 RepID=A0A5N6LFR6_9ASTR|nr:hypothetical protein E3N88_43188 [Mikania micrantha]
MTTLDVARTELALAVLYLNKAEARDKICRAIQYGSKFVSNGEPGTAQNVDKSTSLARKVFRLFKFVNDLHALISPTAPGTPLPIVLLGKSKNALLSTFLFLDQIVWLHRSGIYKNKERAEIIGRVSLFCWMGSSICTTLVELGELGRLSKSMKKLDKELKGSDKYKNEQYLAKLKTSNQRSLALIKAAMDVVVAVGLLQLAPKKVTPRVTGAFGFTSSLISCYQSIAVTYAISAFVFINIQSMSHICNGMKQKLIREYHYLLKTLIVKILQRLQHQKDIIVDISAPGTNAFTKD